MRKAGPGRPKGSKNEITTLASVIAARMNYDPFEALINFSRGDWKALGYESDVYHMEKPDGSVKMGYVVTPQMRLDATKEAMKYIYPTQKSVEIKTGDSGLKIIVEDYTK